MAYYSPFHAYLRDYTLKITIDFLGISENTLAPSRDIHIMPLASTLHFMCDIVSNRCVLSNTKCSYSSMISYETHNELE